MKFGRYLQSHTIEEWRRAYIDYRQLKKQIGRAEQELLAIDAGQAEEDSLAEGSHDEQAPGRGGAGARAERSQDGREAAQGGASSPDPKDARLEKHARDLELGADDSDLDDEDGPEERPAGARSKTAASKREGPSRIASRESKSSPDAASEARSSGKAALLPGHDSDVTDDKTLTSDAPPPDSASKKSEGQIPPILSRPRAPTRDWSTPGKRRWRAGFSTDMTLDELSAAMPKQSRRFLQMLDHDLARVTAFYSDREQEAIKRYEELSAQWQELVSHKKEFQAFQQREIRPPQIISSIMPKNARVPNLPGVSLIRRTLAQRRPLEGGEDGLGAEQATPVGRGRRFSAESQYSNNGQSGSRKDDAGADADDESPNSLQPLYRHGRPEAYTNARSRLKLATFEYYRFLGMLKSYRVLNRTGFTKALKKYEKITLIPCAARYKEKVDSANFVHSTKLDDLIRETENAFASVFERGDRKKALERLRDFGQKKRHHFTAWRAGALMGAGLPLMIEGLVKSFQPSTRQNIPYWPALLQLFGACFLPIFFCLAFFLNMAAWNKARINYVLVFELDIRNKLDYTQFLELPALLYFILSLFWWAAWSNFWPDHIAPSAYPLAWIVVAIVVMLNPFPLLYPSARWWLLRSFLRMITAGLIHVEFRDFFLGDIFTSLYYPMYNCGFAACVYSHHWAPNVFQVCSTNKTWASAILASLAPLWRLGQSFRRYFDSDGVSLHLVNAGKYALTTTYYWMYFSWRINAEAGNWEVSRYVLFIVFASANSVYSFAWDALMDWSLGTRGVKKRGRWLLRNELAFGASWTYYSAAVIDFFLRFAWVLYLAPRPTAGVQSYIIALCEVTRRIMWNTFRVEAEHIGNRDGYRVTRDVPLPYVSAASPEASGHPGVEDDEDDVLESQLSRKARFFHRAHVLHETILKNFQPVIDGVFSSDLPSGGRPGEPGTRVANGPAAQSQQQPTPRPRRRTRQSSSDEDEDEADAASGVAGPRADRGDGGAGLDEKSRPYRREQDRRRRRRQSVFTRTEEGSTSSPDTTTDPGPGTDPEGAAAAAEAPGTEGRGGKATAAAKSPLSEDSGFTDPEYEPDSKLGEGSGDVQAASPSSSKGEAEAEAKPSPPPSAADRNRESETPSGGVDDDPAEDEALHREMADVERMTDVADAMGP